MGIYLNPGNEGFRRAVRSEIYVDKTGLIACTNKYLNTEQEYFCDREKGDKRHSCVIERVRKV